MKGREEVDIEWSPTMRKEYPIQRLLHPRGQVGMVMSWLWTATAWEGASHTEHLDGTTTSTGQRSGHKYIDIQKKTE